jgi:hypothetical protein
MKKYFGTAQVMIQAQIDKALKELEEIESKDCETCIHKDNDVYLEACGTCRNFYANMHEPKIK